MSLETGDLIEFSPLFQDSCAVYMQKRFVKCQISLLFWHLEVLNVFGRNNKPWPGIPKIPSNLHPMT